MKNPQDPWSKLAAVARGTTPDATGESAPYGMATRVIAAWRQQTQAEISWERFGWGALASALTVAILCVALNYNGLRSWQNDDLEMADVSGVETIL